MLKRVGLLAALSALPATGITAAQDLNCETPMSQAEMTGCASLAYEAADKALNAAWRIAMDTAKSADRDWVPDGLPTRAKLLLDAQRAWLAYRDSACEAQATIAYGGTMQNQLYFACLERLTRDRTALLREYGEAN